MLKQNSPSTMLFAFIWLYVLVRGTLYIKTDSLDNAITIMCLFVIIVLMLFDIQRSHKVYFNKVVWLYILLIICTIIPDILHFDMQGIIKGGKSVLPLAALLAMLTIYHNKKELPKNAFTIPIVFGTIVSLQSIVLFLLLFFRVPIGYSMVDYPKSGHVHATYDFLLGLRSATYQINNHWVMRVTSFFPEPAKFAAFLFVPIFFSFALYKKTGKKAFLFATVLNLATFVLTLSRGGFVALTATMFFYWIVKTKKPHLTKAKTKDFLKLFVAVTILVTAVYMFFEMFHLLSRNNPESEILTQFTMVEDGKVTLFRTASGDYDSIFELLLKQPYGYGMGETIQENSENYFTTASAPSYWIYTGGIGAAIILVLLFSFLISRYCIPCIKSKDPVKTAVALLFVAVTVQGISYGDWIGVDYLCIVGLMMLLRDRDILLNGKRRRNEPREKTL